MPKKLDFVMLLDCYGDLLTEHQRNVMELYYCDDLSLSEISTPLGITRQAVADLIKRTENILLDYENKLGFVHRFILLRDCFRKLNEYTDKINDQQLKSAISHELNVGLNLL